MNQLRSSKLIFSSWFKDLRAPIIYFDIGARGDIQEPWSQFQSDEIKIIGFEPDPFECERLKQKYPNRKYYPHALWGNREIRPFYLCKWGSTSSMYPPSEDENRAYESSHWSGRVPVKILEVECNKLDSIVSYVDLPDFIKIDTQGSEFQILKGAEDLLISGNLLVLAETWCTDIYTGMPLTHDVMTLMYGLGYNVFDLSIAAAWRHSNTKIASCHCKQKTIGFDLLFVKRLDQISFSNGQNILKFAGLLELYGFRDYAIAVLERFQYVNSHESANFSEELIHQAISIMLSNDRVERSFLSRILRLSCKIIGKKSSLWPKLH